VRRDDARLLQAQPLGIGVRRLAVAHRLVHVGRPHAMGDADQVEQVAPARRLRRQHDGDARRRVGGAHEVLLGSITGSRVVMGGSSLQPEGHGPVVDERHLHHRTELAGGHRHAARPEALDEPLVQRHRLLGGAASTKLGRLPLRASP
jgi:hypothetical protein